MDNENVDEDLVFFCKDCLSLNIQIWKANDGQEMDFCADCGSTHIRSSPFPIYEKMCKKKGKELVRKTKKPVR